MTAPSFAEIFSTHRGKVCDKWGSYIALYEELFAEFRNKDVSLLEIGIQNGGSLEIYSKYFVNAEAIVGCDNDPKCGLLSYQTPIRMVIGDCSDDQTKRQITAISPSFDIIIDDGSHISKDVIIAFLKYFPILRAGGVFIIEDLHASYWQRWDGGLFHNTSSIAFLKLLVDAVNAEHWGVRETVEDFMALEFPDYRALCGRNILSEIKSISFSNSVCVVRKTGLGETNGLGARTVPGSEALVRDDMKDADGSAADKPDEASNPSSSFSARGRAIAALADANAKEASGDAGQ